MAECFISPRMACYTGNARVKLMPTMNRKHHRSLILFPLSLGVIGVFAGREMASWRPVEVARFAVKGAVAQPSASDHAVAQRIAVQPAFNNTFCALFDTRTGKVQNFNFKGSQPLGIQNGFFWHQQDGMRSDVPFLLKVLGENKEEKSFTYRFPSFVEVSNQSLRILPEQNRVILLDWKGIYTWNFADQRFQGGVEIGGGVEGGSEMVRGSPSALSRDGRTFVFVDTQMANRVIFQTGDTSTGKITKKTLQSGSLISEYVALSPYGRCALINQPTNKNSCQVVETAIGKSLWSFILLPLNSWTISDDEKTIFIHQGQSWQVRDLQTGALSRVLPSAPDAPLSPLPALSPDGRALYSVANGVLYRQRAR